MAKVEITNELKKKNYLSAINLAEGIKSFRHVYALVDGIESDVTKNGDLSCAEFVCFLLLPFRLLSEMHATVAGAVKDLEKTGWHETTELKEGAILIWDKDNNNLNMHIGFYLGQDKAISNSSEKKESFIHHYRHNNREVSKIFWHDSLN